METRRDEGKKEEEIRQGNERGAIRGRREKSERRHKNFLLCLLWDEPTTFQV